MNKRQTLALALGITVLISALVYLRSPEAAAIQWLCSEGGSFYSAMDPVKGSALVVAVVALVVAWNNFRRGNTAIVKLIQVSASGHHALGVNSERPYHSFSVELKNLGIPLKAVSVAITGFSGMGSGHVPLRQFQFDEPAPHGGALEKGMIAKFAIRTPELEPAALAILSSLGEPDASGVNVAVYSNGYLVKRFRVDRPTLKLRRGWNRLAHRINGAFTTRKKVRGREILHPHEVVPAFQDPDFYLRFFVKAAKEEQANPGAPPK